MRFLNDRKDYLSVEQSFNYSLRKEDMEEMDDKGVRGRIVSGNTSLVLAITGGRYSPLSDFQRKALWEIIALCEEIRDRGVYSEVKVGACLYGEGVEIDCESLTNTQLEELKMAFHPDKK
jgi:hypothetical protein